MSGTYYRRGENRSCCPVCGKEYRASEFRRRWDGLWVCWKDYEERHPQDFVRARPDDMRPAVVAGCCGTDGNPQIATAEAPLCPFPLEPLDNATIDNATSVNLSWTTFPGVASYYIYLWEDGDPQPTSPTYTTATSPYFATGLTQNTGYNWYVSAVNSDGEFRDCSGNARFFTTALPLLACPELVTPADAFSFEGDSITLEWNAVSGATSYNVYLFPENGERQLVANTASTSYEATGLELGVTYFWVVTAVNASGESAGCSLRTFSTENAVFLSASSYTVYDSQDEATVVILRDGSIGEVSADYATVDGTAVAPGDYTDTSGTVTWPDGDTESRPVNIPIEPLAEVTERTTDFLPDWVEDGSSDPRSQGYSYDYAYGGNTFSSYAEAKTAAEIAIGYSLTDSLGWRRGTHGTSPTEISGISESAVTALEREFLSLVHSGSEWYSYVDRIISSGEYFGSGDTTYYPFDGFFNLGVPVNKYVFADITINASLVSGVWFLAQNGGGGGGEPAPTTGQNGWVATNNCIAGFGCPYSTGAGTVGSRAQAVTEISVRRLPAAPVLEGSDLPDWPVDPTRFWWDENTDTKYSKEPWSQVSGSFRWLSLYSVTGGGTSTVQRKPLGPVLPVGHPDDNETFWTAARDAAVTAGTLPSSVNTYSSAGTGGIDTFPRNASYAYERTYKLPLEFTVALSSPTGAELIEPDEATIYILPA